MVGWKNGIHGGGSIWYSSNVSRVRVFGLLYLRSTYEYRVWDSFSIKTRMMKGLFGYESAYRHYTQQVIQDFVDDNIQYAEVRPNFPANVLTRDDGLSNINNEDLCQLILDETDKKILTLRERNIFFGGMKVIYCCPRSFDKDVVKEALEECIILKQKFPKLICGMF